MKRIAIQYSGQLRQFLDCFNNHYENFVLQNKDYEVDFFIHSWYDELETDEKRNRVLDIVKPKQFYFEKQIIFNRPDVIQDSRFPWYTDAMLSQFYGIQQVNDMRQKYQKKYNIKYDYVIRLRTDIFFIPNSIKPIDFYEKNFIHIKNYSPFTEHGITYAINDYFAIGSPNLMDIYGNIFNNLDQIIKDGAAINPECLIGFNIKDLPIKKHEFRMWPYRYMLMQLENIKNGNAG